MTETVTDDADLPGMLALQQGVTEQVWPHTIDARVWAVKFNEQFPAVSVDDALGWFANAIMAGYDTALMRAAAKAVGND